MTAFPSDAKRALDWQEIWKFWLTTYWSSWQCAWVFQITAAIETPLGDCCFSFSCISKMLVFNFFFLSFCSLFHLVAIAALLFYSHSVNSTATQLSLQITGIIKELAICLVSWPNWWHDSFRAVWVVHRKYMHFRKLAIPSLFSEYKTS